MTDKTPRLLVFCSLYPSQVRANAGLFIRERMSRVAEHSPLVVVSPVPWFPLQGLVRLFKPGYRPQPASYEQQNGIDVYFPRFLAIPGLFRTLDGFLMAVGALPLLFRLKKDFAYNLIDAHFAYPDGYAATWLGCWFRVPVTITLRGTEVPLSKIPGRRERLLKALQRAARIFSVSESLKRHVVELGADSEKIAVIGNGVDTTKFFAIDKSEARRRLQLAEDAQVLISVGGLVDRKGFHRVIEILPGLLEKHPKLVYLIVGGASPEGNNRAKLEQLVESLGLRQQVRFLGAMASEDLHVPLSAADVFVLATANEGWANVFLEAMACGLPVVTTDVGGNREVVSNSTLGTIVPFGDSDALSRATDDALNRNWKRQTIMAYAADNAWDKRVALLLAEFNKLVNR
ncbi:glycosyltransferase [Methylomonas sp. LL1]|uniref:glycosyltransferase n=1 Tax=Methylomonas sp. LL1 TaxID=2785785 RepID=UPI0018C398EA|nr:glycosyltransferase [Methylomonas sp. LL1]QPK63302.1 glycosyltransferase [Methylomonas sp. LL1]